VPHVSSTVRVVAVIPFLLRAVCTCLGRRMRSPSWTTPQLIGLRLR